MLYAGKQIPSSIYSSNIYWVLTTTWHSRGAAVHLGDRDQNCCICLKNNLCLMNLYNKYCMPVMCQHYSRAWRYSCEKKQVLFLLGFYILLSLIWDLWHKWTWKDWVRNWILTLTKSEELKMSVRGEDYGTRAFVVLRTNDLGMFSSLDCWNKWLVDNVGLTLLESLLVCLVQWCFSNEFQ